MAQFFFARYEQIILVGALPPVSTFAHQRASMHKVPGLPAVVLRYRRPDVPARWPTFERPGRR